MKLNCIWTALPLSELCYSTHWMGKHSWGTNKPYLQAPLSALLSSKVRYIQRRKDKQISCNTRHICFPDRSEKTDFAKKRQSITPWDYIMTSTKAGGQQQQPQAEPQTAVSTTHLQYPRKRHNAASESTEEINMSGLSKVVLNLLQLNGNIWKKTLIASLNHMLSWKSLRMARTCILAHCKEIAFCSKQWIALLATVPQEPKQF